MSSPQHGAGGFRHGTIKKSACGSCQLLYEQRDCLFSPRASQTSSMPVSHLKLNDALSAHWHRSGAGNPLATAHAGIARPQTTPTYFSAPDFNPKDTQNLAVSLSDTIHAGKQVLSKLNAALPFLWMPNSRGTQALNRASLHHSAPAHMRQAAQNAADIRFVFQALSSELKTQLSSAAQASWQQLKNDPLDGVAQLAVGHALSWKETGYEFAKTYDQSPAQLLDPGYIAGLILAGSLRVKKPDLKLASKTDQPVYTLPVISQVAYRSSVPESNLPKLDIETSRGPIRVQSFKGQRSTFSVGTLSGHHDSPYLISELRGRNLGPNRIEIANYSNASRESLEKNADRLATTLLWASTGPQHGLPTHELSLLLHPTYDRQFIQAFNPSTARSLPIASVFIAALNLLGIDVRDIQLDTQGHPRLLLNTALSDKMPRTPLSLDAQLPQHLKAQRIGALISNPSIGHTRGPFARGSIIPSQTPDALDKGKLARTRRAISAHGQDPLDPVDLITVQSQFGDHRYFLPIRGHHQLWAAHLEGRDTIVARHFGLRRDNRDQPFIEAAELFSGVPLRRTPNR